MEKKQVSGDDLRRLMRLVSEIVTLQIKYIERGFSATDIAHTFATIYSRRFEELLTADVAAKIGRDSHQQSPPNSTNAAISYCLKLARAFMKAVADRMKKERE